MPMNRRELVTIGGAIGGAALLASNAEGQILKDQQIPTAKHAEASGRVVSYGEGYSTTFALSEMPEGIEVFGVDDRIHERVGRLLLTAAEKGWEVHVTYRYVEGHEGGTATGVRVNKFQAT